MTNFSVFCRQLAPSIISGVVVKKWALGANGHAIDYLNFTNFYGRLTISKCS